MTSVTWLGASGVTEALSTHAQAVLALLAHQRCVLIGGVPAAGKTRLMNEVRAVFAAKTATSALFAPGKPVAVPAASGSPTVRPSPQRTKPRVWETAMSPSSRFRQFWRDIEPNINGSSQYRVSRGTLWEANEHAKTSDGASLVIIDELNRGPAVEVFGPSIVAIEGDKRLDEDGKATKDTVEFRLAGDDGEMQPYSLSSHLYLLSAMNRADVSAEALDAAFLRRWADYKLYPDETVLAGHFKLSDVNGALPATPDNTQAIYGAAVRAWRAVNHKLTIGAGEDFQLGHGILMPGNRPVATDETGALGYVGECWEMIERHVREVFFGNNEAIAAALYVNERADHPYKLVTQTFAGNETYQLQQPNSVDLYALLRAIADG